MLCSREATGKRIAALRKRGETEISQQELSQALHVSREVVAKWENGTRDLKTEHTIAIADYFGVTCDEILRGVRAENLGAHQMTGLSDESIAALAYLKDETISGSAMLNLLFERGFDHIIMDLADLLQQYGGAKAMEEDSYSHNPEQKEVNSFQIGRIQPTPDAQGKPIPGLFSMALGTDDFLKLRLRQIDDAFREMCEGAVETALHRKKAYLREHERKAQ